jgi:hypothetical protein
MQGARLMTNDDIAEAIREAQAARSKRTQITQVRWPPISTVEALSPLPRGPSRALASGCHARALRASSVWAREVTDEAASCTFCTTRWADRRPCGARPPDGKRFQFDGGQDDG